MEVLKLVLYNFIIKNQEKKNQRGCWSRNDGSGCGGSGGGGGVLV